MKKRINRRKARQTAVPLLIGIALGAFGSAAFTDKEEAAPRTATLYSTTGAESWSYSGNGLRYDETAHKLSYSDPTGAKHTVYTLGYVVEVTERKENDGE